MGVDVDAERGLWRARCIERCPPGSGSGPGKRTSRKAGTAPRADCHPLVVAFVDELCSEGHAVESICRVLRKQGCQDRRADLSGVEGSRSSGR